MATITEREFLIEMAVGRFNRQYGKSFATADFDIVSIPTRVNFDLSYEVYTTRLDDAFRLHMHLLFDGNSGLQNYRLENDGSTAIGILGDEVFVAVGTLERYYKEERVFSFQPMLPDESSFPILLLENGYGILAENGDYIAKESTTT